VSVLALAVTGVLAANSGEQAVGQQAQQAARGGFKEVDLVRPSLGPPPVPLPRHQEREIPGPLVAAGSDVMVVGSGAIVTPRGGAFMSPRERADEAIRRVIRRLG